MAERYCTKCGKLATKEDEVAAEWLVTMHEQLQAWWHAKDIV